MCEGFYGDRISQFVIWNTVCGSIVGRFGTYSTEQKTWCKLFYKHKKHYVLRVDWVTKHVYWFRVDKNGIGVPRIFRDQSSTSFTNCGWSDKQGPALFTDKDEVYVIPSDM